MTAATDEMDEIVVTAIKQDNQISNGSSGGGGGGFLSGLGFGGHDWSGVLSLGPGGMAGDNTAFWLNWITIAVLEQNGLPLPDATLPESDPDPIIIFPMPVLPTMPVPAPEWTTADLDAFELALESSGFNFSDWNYA